MDYIIGVMTDYGIKEIEPWVSSLCKIPFHGKKVMLVYNAKLEVLEKLQELNFDVWVVGKRQDNPNYAFYYSDRSTFNVCTERFYHLWNFLRKIGFSDEDRFIATDVKDVVFQENPFQHLVEDKAIQVSSEWLQYLHEPWGANNMLVSYGAHMMDHMKDREIYNAGVIAGCGTVALDFLLNVYSVAKSSGKIYIEGGGGSDQAAMNIILSMKPWQDHTHFFPVSSSFACQAGTNADPSKIAIFQDNWLSGATPPIFRATEEELLIGRSEAGVFTLNDKYAIVHQYDRVPEWNTFFKNKFKYEAIRK